jgi:cation diffusion facilitator family transporter
MALSILAALSTLGLKYAAYRLTGSVGLLSDAAESIVNLLAAVAAYFSYWYAAQPVDKTHTYGHEKIEFFSSGLEGVLILVAAAAIAVSAAERLLAPQPLASLDVGMTLSGLASLINLGVAQWLLRRGRATRSIVMEADGHHLMTDVWTSVAVLIGVGIVWLTDLPILDPLIALVVSAYIVRTGWGLVRRSFDGLMDHALPAAEQDAVRAAIAANIEPGMDFHALRTRQAGARRFTDFHLLVPGRWSVSRSHQLAERVEGAIKAAIPGIEVTIHVEPIEDRTAWEDSDLLSVERAERSEAHPSDPERQPTQS